jgi:hypothetical protein
LRRRSQLVVVPFYVPLDESPAANTALQNWAVGLVFLKLWVRVMVLRGPLLGPDGDGDGPGGQPANPPRGGGPGGHAARPQAPGVHGGLGGPAGLLALEFPVAVRRVVRPTLLALLDAWAVPRVLGRVLAPLLWPHLPDPLLVLRLAGADLFQPAAAGAAAGAAGAAANAHAAVALAAVAAQQDPLVGLARARRLALPVYLGGKLLLRLAARVGGALQGLHGAIRDERYLLGVQLNNRK